MRDAWYSKNMFIPVFLLTSYGPGPSFHMIGARKSRHIGRVKAADHDVMLVSNSNLLVFALSSSLRPATISPIFKMIGFIMENIKNVGVYLANVSRRESSSFQEYCLTFSQPVVKHKSDYQLIEKYDC